MKSLFSILCKRALKHYCLLTQQYCTPWWKNVGLALLLPLLSCSDTQDIVSRRYPCHFIFSFKDHPTSLAFVAAQNVGSYVYITTYGDGRTTVRHIYVTSNDGHTSREDNIITTEIENNTVIHLGARNDVGIFLGMTNFNGLWAYDRSCPNCGYKTPLNFAVNRQQVSCANCSRIYTLETGAIINGAKGDPLMRYYCSFDGTILRVWN